MKSEDRIIAFLDIFPSVASVPLDKMRKQKLE